MQISTPQMNSVVDLTLGYPVDSNQRYAVTDIMRGEIIPLGFDIALLGVVNMVELGTSSPFGISNLRFEKTGGAPNYWYVLDDIALGMLGLAPTSLASGRYNRLSKWLV